MSKRIKMLTASLLLACIMVATVAGGVFADDKDRDRLYDSYDNDCSQAGDGLRTQNDGQ